MFVLAHLSDPHLSPLPQPHWSELLGKRATGLLNWRHRRHLIHSSKVLARVVNDLRARAPDHIAVTGDLVNISLAGEYAPALNFLESLGSPRDVSLVPGNHDAYVRGAESHYRAHWGDYMRCDDGMRLLGFPFLRRRGPLALIGLSSAVPTAPFMGTGWLGEEQVTRLARLLDECGREGLFRVVLIHHPPASSRRRHFRRLIDAARFRATLAKHGAELVLHGHDHTHSVLHLQGPQQLVPALGVPSASQIARSGHGAAGYNLCRIDGHAGAWRCEIAARRLAPDGETMTERTVLASGYCSVPIAH
jgi:3',5'-cyclic AMP phosphodiesterase CpdA